MRDILTVPWRVAPHHPGVVLAANGVDLLTVDSERNQSLTDAEALSVAGHIVKLHNASLLPEADPWIEIVTLGEPVLGAWPWDGAPVLIHAVGTIPKEPGRTGQARYTCGPDRAWDWWWTGDDRFRDPPVRGVDGPVTHVRRIVPPVEG